MKIQYVIAIHLRRWLTNFYNFRLVWTVTAAIGIHPTKAWLSSWWISKMQSGRGDTLEERHAIKFCFKLGKNATETYGMLQTAFRPSCKIRASAFEWHKRFKEGRKSIWDDKRCGRSKEVNRPELMAKGLGLGLGLLCWGLKRVQEEIPWEEVSTLRVGSVAFPPGQCTSP